MFFFISVKEEKGAIEEALMSSVSGSVIPANPLSVLFAMPSKASACEGWKVKATLILSISKFKSLKC